MSNSNDHTSNEIWTELTQQAGAISQVRAEQAATTERINSLETAVDSGFRSISAELQTISNRVNSPPNYSLIVAMGVAMLGMFGGYALLITGPLSESIMRNERHVDELMAHRQRTAALEAHVERLVSDVDGLEEFRAEAHFIHGQREELGKRVEDIDNQGSRRWNSRSPDGN